ncbi:copper resistance protein NlpE N-terminal domain-containing protein [Pantoea sp. BAV 3049]|uniref:copper resistance protein NlpE N-terminal domain-containing protein n=1 Tax=Pantoea sp. BAV 3049 TaxID=2654188 RepID=UPI00131DD2CE|nr:copper resistance protein NlpE N-terminal domain-containing protein [Pantoea sp. BAV 3049]
MKKIIVAMLVTLFFGSLLGCQNHETVSAAQTPDTMMQKYQGVIPCADCEGIQVSLSLQQGGRYTLSEHYLGSSDVSNAQQGHWSRTAEKLVLISDKGEKRYFRPLNDGLEMMDTQGNPIQSVNSYRLAAVKEG